MKPLLISIADGAQALGLGRTTVNQLIRSGELDTVKVGRRRLITVASIERLAGEQD